MQASSNVEADERHAPLAVVAGATGFIGSAALRGLAAEGFRVTSLRRDWSDADLDGADVVVNAAGSAGRDSGRANDAFARRLADEATRRGIPLVVVSNLGASEGSPAAFLRARARSDAAALDFGRERGAKVLVLRPSLVLGGSSTRLLSILARIGMSPEIPSLVQPVSIDALTARIVEAAKAPESGTEEIGGPEVLSVDALADLLAEGMGRRIRRISVGPAALRAGLRAAIALGLPGASLDLADALAGDTDSGAAGVGTAGGGRPPRRTNLLRVLVVEKDVAEAGAIRSALAAAEAEAAEDASLAAFTLDVASTGSVGEALALTREPKGSTRRVFDAIVVGCGGGEGVMGVEAMRAGAPRSAIVAVLNEAGSECRVQALREGADACVAKEELGGRNLGDALRAAETEMKASKERRASGGVPQDGAWSERDDEIREAAWAYAGNIRAEMDFGGGLKNEERSGPIDGDWRLHFDAADGCFHVVGDGRERYATDSIRTATDILRQSRLH